MNKMMKNIATKYKVLYLTWGENIVDYGIFKTQVKDLIEKLQSDERFAIQLLSGVPVGRKFLFNPKQYSKKLEITKDELSKFGVIFTVRKLVMLSRWFQSLWLNLPSYQIPHLLFLYSFLKRNEICLVHCRSYNAALLAVLIKKFFLPGVKVIFDTRGLLPEEGVISGCYDVSGLSYRIWKKIEKFICNNADAIVNVSEPFTRHISKITNHKDIYTIPTSVNLSIFKVKPDEKLCARKEMNIPADAKVLVYSGSIGKTGWHRIDVLLKVYKVFKKFNKNSRLLVVTQSSHQELYEGALAADISVDELVLVSADSQEKVSYFLNAADYATLSYKEVKSEIEKTVSKTVIACKTGEYLGCGLPVIVNREAVAAAEIVEGNKVGCLFDLDNIGELEEKLIDIESSYDEMKWRCPAVAEKYFSAENNVEKYKEIYIKLLN